MYTWEGANGDASVVSTVNTTIGGDQQGSLMSKLVVNGELNLSSTRFRVTSQGLIDGKGQGFASNAGPGNVPSSSGSGASHAGRGGNNNKPTGQADGGPYGNYKWPTTKGSGGPGAQRLAEVRALP